MEKLSEHFNRSEFACECGCGLDTVDHMLVVVLERLRNHFGVPIEITGPNRCKEHNETVQKQYNPRYVPYSSKTTHMDCKAVDFKVKDVLPEVVADLLDKWYPNEFGIGRYFNRTHLDTRGNKARWGSN